MADTLTHSSNSNTRATSLNFRELFCWYPFAFILNLQRNALFRTRKLYRRSLSAGVSMNIRQAFLYDAENRDFHVFRQSSEVLRDNQLTFQIATFSQALDIPLECSRQAILIQQGRMKQIRHSTYLITQLVNQFTTFHDDFTNL